MVNKKSNESGDIVSENNYHARVTQELKLQGKSQQWLADSIGKNKQDMQRILKMNKNPKYIHEISEVLEISPEWLKSGEGEKYIYRKVKSIPINLYSLLDFKLKKSLAATKPIEEISIIDGNSNFALLMDDLTISSARYPENCLLLFQTDFDYEDTVKNSKITQYVLLHQTKDNIISFCQVQFTNNNESMLYKPMENYPDKPSYKATDCEILGLLKETRVRF